MAVVDYAKAGMYASDANLGARRGLSDPTIANNRGNVGAGAMLKAGIITGALFVASLSPVQWNKFNSGITVTGAGVSQWSDQTANANHFLQGTDANRPALQGDGSILFDGLAFHLRATYTLNQPLSIYLLGRQVTWTLNRYVFDGASANGGRLFQSNTSPKVALGIVPGFTGSGEWAINEYDAVSAVINGASSSTQINNNPAVTGDAGSNNPGGTTLGCTGGTPASFSNIQAKEFVVFNSAHAGMARSRMITYLAGVGNLFI